jgi:hypothetical protein
MSHRAPLWNKAPRPSHLRVIALATAALIVTLTFPACIKSKSWATRDVTDLTVDLPFALGPGPDVKTTLPPEVYAKMEYFEAFDTGTGTNPRVAITRMKAKPGVPVSLDGATNGAMNGAIGAFNKAPGGGTNVQFTTTPLTIDGLQARKATYTGQAEGTSAHVDGVFIQNGQKVWQVQIITTGDSSAADITRIVDSIHIKPDATK